MGSQIKSVYNVNIDTSYLANIENSPGRRLGEKSPAGAVL